MTDLPANLFLNPVWSALHTAHSRFAITAGEAARYPADVTPFVAVSTPSASALEDLANLLAPAESVWIVADPLPSTSGLSVLQTLDCLQMVLPPEVTPEIPSPGPSPTADILALSCADAPDMVALTDVAFPGFFRSRTCEMGAYFGIRHNGQLIAMAGERLTLTGYPEISGICTHPGYRGKGLAARLIAEVVRHQRRYSLLSWLHVAARNRPAIQLYLRLGFVPVRTVTLHQLRRTG